MNKKYSAGCLFFSAVAFIFASLTAAPVLAAGVCHLDSVAAKAADNELFSGKAKPVSVAKTENLSDVHVYKKQGTELLDDYGDVQIQTNTRGTGTLQKGGTVKFDPSSGSSQTIQMDKNAVFHMDIGDSNISYKGQAILDNKQALVSQLERIPQGGKIQITTELQKEYDAIPRLDEVRAQLKPRLSLRSSDPNYLSFDKYQAQVAAAKQQILSQARPTPISVDFVGVSKDGQVFVRMPITQNGMSTGEYRIVGYDLSTLDSVNYQGALRTNYGVPKM